MNAKQLIHRWAQQEKSDGRSGNVHFSSTSLNFYRREIACFYPVLDKEERQIVGVSRNTYSPLTTQKQNLAWQATTQYRQIPTDFFTDCLDRNWERARLQIVNAALKEIHEAANELPGKRNVIDRIDRIQTKASNTLLFFREFCKRREYPKNSPVSFFVLCQLARDRASARDQLIKHYAPKLLQQFERDEYRQAHAEEIQRAKNAAIIAKEQERLKDWLASGPSDYFYHLPIALRVRASTNEIETSRGARVPINAALLLYDRLITSPETVAGFKIGDFTVRDFIGSNGDRMLRVGCHEIPFKEIERIRGEL